MRVALALCLLLFFVHHVSGQASSQSAKENRKRRAQGFDKANTEAAPKTKVEEKDDAIQKRMNAAAGVDSSSDSTTTTTNQQPNKDTSSSDSGKSAEPANPPPRYETDPHKPPPKIPGEPDVVIVAMALSWNDLWPETATEQEVPMQHRRKIVDAVVNEIGN